ERKVRDITSRRAAMAHVHSEMWPRRLEIGGYALGNLMDVQRMVSRRKALDVQLDANAARRLGESGGAHTLSLGILDVDGNRLGCRRRVGLRHPPSPNQKTQTHESRDRSHDPSLLSLDVPALGRNGRF